MTEPFDRELSVVIPTLNRAKQLGRCLDALKRQTLAPDRFEAVIVDNGSDAATLDAVRRAAGETTFRTSVLVEPRRGPAAARNRGIEASRGQRILFLGDDILASPALLAEHLAAAAGAPDCAVLGFTDWATHLRLTPFMRYLAPERGPQFRYATIADPRNCGYQFFYTSNISLPRKWFDLERFDERFAYAVLEDADLGYRLQKRGLRIVFHRAALAWHDHAIRFRDFVRRMDQLGESMVLLYHKCPELAADPNIIPSEGHRPLLTRAREVRMAIVASLIAAADSLGFPLPERLYQRVLEYHFVRSFLATLDREQQAG